MDQVFDRYKFLAGDSFEAYRYFGAQWLGDPSDPTGPVMFRVYAPASPAVELVSDLDAWEGQAMVPEGDGIWSLLLMEVPQGLFYKYKIQTPDGTWQLRGDPYATAAELPPGSASRIQAKQDAYRWNDDAWLKARSSDPAQPLNIYEIHIGSWVRRDDGTQLSYRQLADPLIEYLTQMKFTHVEFMPILEHELYASWGYQTSYYFAPTARYGEPEDLKYLIDRLHQAGFGVIFDFVPMHFIANIDYLREFDGTHLYEYVPSDVSVSEWGTVNFNYYNGAVRSFLQSAADRLLSVFHGDGLRIDAVSHAIYWMGDEKRGVNPGGVNFLRSFNRGLRSKHEGIILIAEDSSNYPGVTASALDGGLDFHYKWDMGWMHDTLNYFRTPPAERPQNYTKLSFNMMYKYNERFLLPLSHDEVVHGKATIAQKMWGDYDQKFYQLRTLYAYMTCYPGKKHQFMGNEIAHFREWDEEREQDWDLLQYPVHDAFQSYFQTLNTLYRTSPALYASDYDREGFQWLEVHAAHQGFYAFRRDGGGQTFFFLMNTLDKRQEVELKFDQATRLTLLLSSEDERWNGRRRDPAIGKSVPFYTGDEQPEIDIYLYPTEPRRDYTPEADDGSIVTGPHTLRVNFFPYESLIFSYDGDLMGFLELEDKAELRYVPSREGS